MLSNWLFTVTIAAGVSATVLDPGVLFGKSLGLGLHSRQLLDPTTFPEACQRTCTPIINTFNTCVERKDGTELDCFCSVENGQAYETCVNCMVSTVPSPSFIEQGQDLLDQYDEICVSYNLPKHTLDVPGGPSATPSGSANPSVAPSRVDTNSRPPNTLTTPSFPSTPSSPTASVSGNDDPEPSGNGNPFAPGGNGAASLVVNGVVAVATIFGATLLVLL